MLRRRHGAKAFAGYTDRREPVRAQAQAYDAAALKGQFETIYHFGEGMIDETLIRIDQEKLDLPGFANTIDLVFSNPYADMCD
jgi:acetoacetyl-[acyl-carrier protein] synthase